MVRIKTNVYSHKRKKRVMKEAKGQFGNRSKRYKEAAKSLTASKQYAYFDRKKNKSHFRSLWIIRINAACQELGTTYSRLVKGLFNANITIDRKVLSELAISAPEAFAQIVDKALKAPAVVKDKKVKVYAIKGGLKPNSAAAKKLNAKKAVVKKTAVKKVAKAKA